MQDLNHTQVNCIECTVVAYVVVSGACVFCFDRKFCTALIYSAIFLLVFFWTIPVGFISSLIALQNLAKVVSFLEPGEVISYTCQLFITRNHEIFNRGVPRLSQINQTYLKTSKDLQGRSEGVLSISWSLSPPKITLSTAPPCQCAML